VSEAWRYLHPVCRGSALALLLLVHGGCGGTQDAAPLSVEVTGLPRDSTRLHFKIYRAECVGSRPCDTWLAQVNVSANTSGPLPYLLQLPPEVLELPVQLRIDALLFMSSCVAARGTTTMTRKGAEYAGASLRLSLDRDSLGPPLAVTMPNTCPFSYAPAGSGRGTVVLSRSGAPDLSDSSRFPDEFPRSALVTATALPGSGSRFKMWQSPAACASMTQTTCRFVMDTQVQLVPVFE
jgi:hypothetical protein